MSVQALPSRLPLAPGIVGMPGFALMRNAATRPLEIFRCLHREYGDTVRVGPGNPLQYILVFHPRDVEHMLAHNHKNYRKGRINAQFRVLDGDGLVTSEDALWQRQRRLVQPAFHRQRLRTLGAGMTECAHDLAAEWSHQARAGQLLDVMPDLMGLTLRIAGRALFGVELSDQAEAVHPAVDVAREYITWRMYQPVPPPVWLPTPRSLQFQRARALLDRIVYGIIAERRRTGADNGDVIAMLLRVQDEETGAGMDDRQLRDEVMTMLMAGHESTAVALTWTLYLLGTHPEAQVRAREEVEQVLNGRDAGCDDLPQLAYARMVIEEALRLYPPAWALSRQAIQEDTLGGYRVPAGSYVTTAPYVVHRHPEFWDDPERFRPERFAPEAVADRPRFAYFPFGGGPRGCIGNHFALMEAQLVLATMLQRFEWTYVEDRPLELEALLSLRPKHGVRIRARELPR